MLCPRSLVCLQTVMESILKELLNTALSTQIAADPAPGTKRLIASHSREIHRVPYYQLAAQAEQRLIEQQQQSSQALQQQATAAAAAAEAAVVALKESHETEVNCPCPSMRMCCCMCCEWLMTCGICCADAKHASPTQVTFANLVACHLQEMCLCESSICPYKLQQPPTCFMINLCHCKLGRCKAPVLFQEGLT